MHRARITRALRLLPVLALIAAVPLFGLSACFGMSKPPQVAATVNGDVITEDEVTEFIEGFRKKNVQYESDSAWAEFLKSNGYTAESLRSYVIDTVFIPQRLIAQQCEERGIQIGDTDLDEVIRQEKEYYERRYGENSWESVLASYGYDEKSWRENELNRLLEEQLRDLVIDAPVPSEAEIQVQANEGASTYNGKDSYYIEFADEQAAQAARQSVAGAGDRVTLARFSSLGDVVHAGWNSLPSTRDSMSTEYIQASDELEVGAVSQPVNVDGRWMLIYCDASFNVGAGGESVVTRDIPQEIYEQIVADTIELKTDELFDEWLAELMRSSDIVIESMPDGLPYNVSAVYDD